MGLFDFLKSSSGGSIVTDTVKGAIDGIAGIADEYIQTEEEKQEFLLKVKEHNLKELQTSMEKDAQIMSDRQNARAMSSTHAKLQSTFAMAFLVGYFLIMVADLFFVAYIIYIAMDGTTEIPAWGVGLIGTTLGSVTTGMTSMLKEVVGFLFGGSAGGDATGQALADVVKTANVQKEEIQAK